MGIIQPYAAAPDYVITQFQSGHGWGAAAGSFEYNDTTDFVIGSQSAWVETAAGGVQFLRRYGMAPIDFSDGYLLLRYKMTNSAGLSQFRVDFGVSGNTSRYEMYLLGTQAQRYITDDGWTVATFPIMLPRMSVVGTPDIAATTDIQVRIVALAGQVVRMQLQEIGVIARIPGVVSIAFDDQWSSVWDTARPYLHAAGFPATCYLIAERVGDAGRLSMPQIQSLQNAYGWEMGSHSYASTAHDARYTTMAPEDVTADILAQRAWMATNGIVDHGSFAYPGGNYHFDGHATNVLPICRDMFSSARTISDYWVSPAIPGDLGRLQTIYISDTDTLAATIVHLDRAMVSECWPILVFHNIVTTPVASTDWATSDFEALIDHIATQGYPVKTVAEHMASISITDTYRAQPNRLLPNHGYSSVPGSMAALTEYRKIPSRSA